MMTDTLLLYTGAGVFGLMLIGIIFTILEFRHLRERDEQRNP
jgi:hypothetical protein